MPARGYKAHGPAEFAPSASSASGRAGPKPLFCEGAIPRRRLRRLSWGLNVSLEETHLARRGRGAGEHIYTAILAVLRSAGSSALHIPAEGVCTAPLGGRRKLFLFLPAGKQTKCLRRARGLGDESVPRSPPAKFLFLRRKKLARRIFLFLFSFLRRMDGKMSKSCVKFLKR